MSIRLSKSTIECDSLIELIDTSSRVNEILTRYAEKHKDFSVIIEEDKENNNIIVKTIHLSEHVN